MNFIDIIFVIQWWLVFFLIGLIFLPLTIKIFSTFFDKGYIFSKILGVALISYVVFLLGILKVAPFTELTIFIVILISLILNILISKYLNIFTLLKTLSHRWKIFLFEEILFLSALFFWSYIRAHQPDIQGLEKYMDFGFINSIIRSEYFPPVDMWFTPLPINYYYFGHLTTAVLTKISTIPSSITYNLMLSTVFAFLFTAGFSIGANLTRSVILSKRSASKDPMGFFANAQNDKMKTMLAGLLSGFLISMAGNLHAIYAFFKPYVNENPIPFWQLTFGFNSFPNSYWYPNATRFIYNTIHEFPMYSFVVSDLHGHVLDIPFVLLTIAVLFAFINYVILRTKSEGSRFFAFQAQNDIWILLLLAFLLAIMYMTNAWDGIIYFLLTVIVICIVKLKSDTNALNVKGIRYSVLSIMQSKKYMLHTACYILLVFAGFFIFSLPFNFYFKPFASGIGVLCAPDFLTKIGNFGPFLFEIDHCQHSPLWQLLILYGFFYFWAISFIVFLSRNVNLRAEPEGSRKILPLRRAQVQNDIAKSDLFVLLLIIFSTFLIILPEFIYVKDIYPGHYRANTMFKLAYQAFIMLSISSAYIVVRLILNRKLKIRNWKFVYWVIGIIGLLLVSVYPYFAINSYYGELKTYYGLDGFQYLKRLYPTDYEAILWINKNIQGQPVILEAQGDSYTDFGRVSANTGLPTVLGWTVHEWLWRGTYDIPAPRIPEVQQMYESQDLEETKSLLKKYKVSLVFLGTLEREKYPNLNEEKFKALGKVIYENGETKIYEISL